MTRYLITGARGFIGRHLARCIGASEPSSTVIMAGRERDLTDPTACGRLFEESGPLDYIFHLADVSGNAQWSASHSVDQFLANAKISLHVLESWRTSQPSARLVGFGSLWAYPAQVSVAREEDYWDGPLYGPTQHYGSVKKFLGAGIQAAKQQLNLKGTMLVLGSVYGPGDRSDHVIPTLIRKMRDNPRKLEVMGDGLQTRDFVFVDDQVRAILLHKDFDGDLLNISGGESHSIRRVVDMLVSLMHYSGEVVFQPQAEGGPRERSLDVTRARRESGWPASFALHSLETGLSRTVEDILQNG